MVRISQNIILMNKRKAGTLNFVPAFLSFVTRLGGIRGRWVDVEVMEDDILRYG